MKIEEVSKHDLQQKVLESMLIGSVPIYVAAHPMPNEEWLSFRSELADAGIAATLVEFSQVPVQHKEGIDTMRSRIHGCWIIKLDASEARAALEALGKKERS